MMPLPLSTKTQTWVKHAAGSGQSDAQVLLHLLDRADKRDRDVEKFLDSYSRTIAALCRRLDVLERGANDLPAPAAPEPVEPESEKCETCDGEGTIDETLGGWSDDNPAATCPDCDGVGEPRRFHRQAPAAPVDAGPVANALLRAEAALADVAEGEAARDPGTRSNPNHSSTQNHDHAPHRRLPVAGACSGIAHRPEG